MVKISHVAAAASTAGAALAILSPTVLIDNNSVQPAISNSHDPNYQFLSNGYQTNSDEYLRELVANLEDSARLIRALPDPPDDRYSELDEIQKALADDEAAEKAEEDEVRQVIQQAWMVRQSRAADPPQVMYCTVYLYVVDFY